ncbi:MAG: HAMP domain-containing sensor histidine kinase [Lachnospiraceae bacterium]
MSIRNGVSVIFSRVKQKIAKSRLVRSLRFRIFLIICLAGIIPGIILRAAILNNYETRAVSVRTAEIQNQCTILANHLVTYSYLNDPSSEVINSELEQLSNLYDGRVLVIDRDLKIVKDTYSISQGKTMISEEVVKGFGKEPISKYDNRNHYIEITTPITDRKSGEVIGVMLTSVSTDSIVDTLSILGQKAVILEFSMAILIFTFAYFVSLYLIKPFRRVVSAINEMKEGFTGERIHVPDYSETEALSESFNQMVASMQTLDESRQEFVSNVSHELKTPITSIKVLAESLVSQENVPIELYQEFMKDIVEEIDREDKIINDLLALVKMDKTAADMNIALADINETVEIILKRLRPIANTRNIELVLESIRPVNAEIDEVKFTLAISNLIENAIKYNIEDGWVKVTVDADHQFFTVEVSDSGIGIPEESQAHIFERFYRVDKSHSREIGGTGLGLAITRNAVLMHRGAVKVSSEEGKGTIFTVKIPRSYIA